MESLATLSNRSALSRIISPRELMEVTGLAPATLWRLRRRGELPEPIRLSPNRVGWRESVINAWLDGRQADAGAR